MNIIKTLLIVLVLNFGFSMSANASAYITGNSYLKLNESHRGGYIGGIVDSMQTLSDWGYVTAPEIVNMETCTNRMTLGQLVAIVDKYLENNPEIWHKAMSSLTINALVLACKKKPQ